MLNKQVQQRQTNKMIYWGGYYGGFYGYGLGYGLGYGYG